MELIKLLLMQKYLMGKDDSEANKEFYKLLKIEKMKDQIKKIFRKNIDFVPDKNKKILQGIIYV